MKIIYLILIFLVPGLIIEMMDEAESPISNKKHKSGTIYKRLFWIVVRSVILSAISIFLIYIFHSIMGFSFPNTLSTFMSSLDRLDICSTYLLTMLIITICFKKLILNKCLRPLWFRIHNKQLAKKYGVQKASSDSSTIWESIFLNTKTNPYHLVATIYKDGIYITSGIIHAWNADINEPHEYELIRTSEIEKVLKADESRESKDKWLNYIDFEYFESNSGLLIKFYDSEKLFERWNEIEK